ncbi:hypothetical protein G7L32_26735 [Klebsiella quasipneumoniae]|nr:hypothetical protein [Klebsiella quasipneumoniae]
MPKRLGFFTRLLAGQVVEHGDVGRLFAAPQQAVHPRADRRYPPGFPPLSAALYGERDNA